VGRLIRQCWASRADGCSEKISREHVVSKSILKRIGHFNLQVEHEGVVTFQKEIGINSATVKFLCKNHNSALSPYDKEGLKFIKTIDGFSQSDNIIEGEFTDRFGIRRLVVDGYNLERWAAKTFLNSAAFIQAVDTNEPAWTGGSSNSVFDAIFDCKPIEKPFGLYQVRGINFRAKADFKSRDLCFKVIPSSVNFYDTKKGHWIGKRRVPGLFYFSIYGIDFLFNMNLRSFRMEKEPDMIGPFLKLLDENNLNYYYRPKAIGISRNNEPMIKTDIEDVPPRVIEINW
tara:strand:+ start:571 stop:1431 length:861 start_codon:yes stop_codon:yes gene_type:complete